jgi:small subunit ribosomal protein S5
MAVEKEKDDFEEKVLFINRCSKVVKGGRKFSFSALILVGDRKEKVGFGFAKAKELSDAIRKGGEQARKNLISFARNGTTIPHEVQTDQDGATVLLKPGNNGVVAGSYIRSICELAGLQDVMGKSLGANNPVNLVRATFKALAQLQNRSEILEMRER